MKQRQAFIAVLFYSTLAIRLDASFYKTLNLYKRCDSACFLLTVETKSNDRVSVSHSSNYYSMKRVAKPFKWYSYDIKCFDTNLSIYSHFNGESKGLLVADSSINLRNDDFYQFNKDEQPFYIWDAPFLPFHKGYLGYFNFPPKYHSETDHSILYTFKNKYYSIVIEVNKENALVCSYTIIDILNGYTNKYNLKYFYFKADKNIYLSSTKENKYLPVKIENEHIKNAIIAKLAIQKENSKPIDTSLAIKLLKPYLSGDKQALLIDFWHISCWPCRRALPLLDSLSVNAKNGKTAVLLIAVHDSEEDVAYFKKKYNFSFVNYCDTGHVMEKFFKPPSYPTTILLDNNLKEKIRISGASKSEILLMHRGWEIK